MERFLYFITDENGLCAYDSKHNIAYVFKDNNWEISDKAFCVIALDEGITEITKKSALKLSNGKNLESLISEKDIVL